MNVKNCPNTRLECLASGLLLTSTPKNLLAPAIGKSSINSALNMAKVVKILADRAEFSIRKRFEIDIQVIMMVFTRSNFVVTFIFLYDRVANPNVDTNTRGRSERPITLLVGNFRSKLV